jgi:putative PIN family toxin of toxin-antitoxin system
MNVVVFDTNILLDLFVFNDFRAIHLKQALLERNIDAIATLRTLEEFADVISRPLFSITLVDQEKILQQWTSLARILDDKNIVQSPWKCQDPDDQIFLDLAYTARPCKLVSKDNEVLKFANTALTDGVIITANYQALEL